VNVTLEFVEKSTAVYFTPCPRSIVRKTDSPDGIVCMPPRKVTGGSPWYPPSIHPSTSLTPFPGANVARNSSWGFVPSFRNCTVCSPAESAGTWSPSSVAVMVASGSGAVRPVSPEMVNTSYMPSAACGVPSGSGKKHRNA
jgi:hypothetical protein